MRKIFESNFVEIPEVVNEIDSMQQTEINLKAEEFINELNQCRKDGRASENQIFQILAAVITFLTVLATLSNIDFFEHNSRIFLKCLITFLLCAVLPYIANLGLLSTFQHRYLVDVVERKLSTLVAEADSEGFYHWEEISTPLITLNRKKVSFGFLGLYCFNYHVAFVSILLLAVTYFVMIKDLLESSSYSSNYIDFVLNGIFLLVLSIVVVTLLLAVLKSKKFYELAKINAKQRREGTNYKNNSGTIRVFLYFIYPRIKDCQKTLFIVLGYILGVVIDITVKKNFSFSMELFKNHLILLLFTLFVIDFLVYQARYLWNDLRGIKGDMSHPLCKSRGRIPIDVLGVECATIITVVAIIVRLCVAAVVWVVIGGEACWNLGICSVLVLVLGIAYEAIRSMQWVKGTLSLVCLGYPLRLLAGAWSACPDLFQTYSVVPTIMVAFFLILFATAAFGESFVTLTWVLEASYLAQKGQIVKKKHLVYLFEQLDDKMKGCPYPLKNNLRPWSTWNKWYIVSFLLLCLTVLLLVGAQQSSYVFAIVIIAMLFLWQLFAGNQAGTKRLMVMVFLCIFEYVIYAAFFFNENFAIIFLTCMMQLIYMIVHVSFCNSNYEELYGFIETLANSIKTVLRSVGRIILGIIVGEETMSLLFSRQR